MALKDIVDELYTFRDHYFEHHETASEDQKIKDLSEELNKTLKNFNEQKDEHEGAKKAEYDLLKAKALNILPDFNPEALEILTKLVKFHPKLIEAWNELGTCFWKKGDMKAAKSCFESALREEKNVESLRNLSMILRQMGQSPEDKLAKIHESLEKAKEAVNLNIQDGKSWYILGNAYLSLYFTTDQNPNLLKQCLSAYNHSFSDASMKCNPDLYYNWAMALKYDENYRLALENFEKALKYDPFWNDPKEQLDMLMKHLENIQLMISKKGKMKPRKIKEILSSLQKELAASSANETFTDKKGQKIVLERSKFSGLKEGLNANKILRGKVICHVYCTDSPSFTFCMIDEEETCFCVNVYNMVQGKGVIIGDSVAIYQPFLQHFNFTFQDKTFAFSSIRVNSPLQLEVNKKKLGQEVIAAPRLSVTLKSD
ncbi:tetratricopeptide repeat protein 5-like [Argiope bruennichi]|uniref:tetratricopeptide repeat protein 5-like n=1 Tax=Argiope bruennichi TaxID=94029 RepID=UPI0024943F45|nr:tetratricopeptide repeat protein 5-like [Argiope bruennichi]